MKEVSLEAYAFKHGREKTAELIGCHWTLISDVLKKKRKVFLVLDRDDSILNSYEVKDFPNKRMSNAKQQKTSVLSD